MEQAPDLSTPGARLLWLLEVASPLSQRSLCVAGGLAASTLSVFFMRYRADPATATLSADSAQGIAGAIGCKPGWLLFNEGAPPTEADVRAAGERIRAAEAEALPATGTEG